MKRTWFYFSNQFDNATRQSNSKMLNIANDHDSRLQAEKSDPDINTMWLFFNPLLLDFRNLYSLWQSAVSLKVSKTLIFTNLLKELSEIWIRQWEGKVFFYFPEGSPEATAIFPRKRAPFQAENYEDRIQAVYTLAESMRPYEELREVVGDVNAKYQLLVQARDAQKQAMQMAGKRLEDLEKQRRVLATALFKNVAGLMSKFNADPAEGQRFFNKSLIRKPGSDTDAVFTLGGEVNAGLTQVLALPKKFSLSINALASIVNSQGGSPLHFFFADNIAAQDSPLKGTVAPGESLEISAGELGWSSTNTYLIVKNAGSLTAEYELTMTEAVV